MFNVCKQRFLDSIRTVSGLNRSAFSMSLLKRGNSSSGDLVRMAVSDIREEQGDLFSAPPSTSLAHCVSSDLKMGAGIAVLFRKKFGCVEDLKNQNKSVGEVAHLEDGGRFIFYLITKPRFYDKPTEATLLRSLVELRDLCEEFRVRRLAMPRIGCGLDGLQWPVVYEMIKEVFAHCNMEVTIYSIPERKSMTPNLLRTQEKFRSFFDAKRPSSLPANAMASKRKLHSYPSDDEFDTPKKRLKTSSFDSTSYQKRNSLPHSLGRRITQSVNLNRSVEDDHLAHHSHLKREKKATSSSSGLDKSDFWSPTLSKSKDFIPFISDEGTKGVRFSQGSKRLSYPPSDCDEESPATKKRKNREYDELYNREDDSSQPRDGRRGENEKRTPRILESEDSDCDRKKHRKSSSSSKSKARKSRGSSKSKERKSRDSCRGKERTSRSSSNSKERKSRSLSRSKERRSRDSGRSKERRSRDSSRSTERRSRDSSRSKERKLRDSIKSKEKKLRDSSRSRLSGSVERECKHSNEKQANDLQYSDQSDKESVDSATCVSITTKETYQRSETSLEGLANVSARKLMTSSQQGSKSNIVTEYSVSYKVKKPKYPSLDISMTDKRVSKSASTGGLYSDRANTNSSVKSRLSLSGKS